MTEILTCPVRIKVPDTNQPQPCGSPTWDTTRMCGLHLRGMQADIDDICWAIDLDADHHDDLLTATGESSGRSVADSKPPLRVAAILSGDTEEYICGWAADVIHTSRTLGLPEASRLLARHVFALACHDAIVDIYRELHQAAHDCREVIPDDRWNDEERDKRAAILGRCPQPDPRGERDACGGPLRWRTPAWASHVSDDLAAIEVECARCKDVWGMADLPHILRVVQPRRRFPVPRAWVCKRYRINPSTLRQWIYRGQVRTYSDEQVELFDVLARINDDTPEVSGA